MKVHGALVALVSLLVLAIAAPASAGVGLNAYNVKAGGAKELRALKRAGFDLTEAVHGKRAEIVATDGQVAKLRRAGLTATLVRDNKGRTAQNATAAAEAAGFEVWRPWARTDIPLSGAAGNPTQTLKAQMESLARKNSKIAKLETI